MYDLSLPKMNETWLEDWDNWESWFEYSAFTAFVEIWTKSSSVCLFFSWLIHSPEPKLS